MPWTADDIPDQSGRTAAVTGASSGIGLETARVLADRGATVICASRHTTPVRLDLASLASVREAAAEIRERVPRLDLLVCNAGVMDVPARTVTEDGFELMFATNHLGHFALTGLLLDRLLAAEGSRIVTVSSVAHRRGAIEFDDLQSERSYDAGRAYAQSKLANLLFTNELQSRLAAAGAGTIALAAHPGNARTNLWQTSSKLERALISPRLGFLNSWAVQSVERGALPTLRAATDPSAKGGEYYGPDGWFEFTGAPALAEQKPKAVDPAVQRRLWEVSEELTGVTFPV